MNEDWKNDPGNEHGQPESGSLVHSLQDRVRGVSPNPQYLVERIDRFLPASVLAGPVNELRRARLTVAAGFAGGVAVSLTLVATTELSSISIRVASYLLAATFLASPLMLKRGFPAHWMQNGLIGVMCIYSVGLSATTGGG